jgi:hypothetical protein
VKTSPEGRAFGNGTLPQKQKGNETEAPFPLDLFQRAAYIPIGKSRPPCTEKKS